MTTAVFKYAMPGSVKDVDAKQGIVTAYGSAFETEDYDGDIIERGAYAKSISERGPAGSGRIKVLYMHHFDEPIGKMEHLEEDSVGLLARFKLLDTQRGRDTLKLYEADLLEHSVGIDILRRSDEDRRRVKEIRLWEVSPVTWGANPNTPLVSLKGSGLAAAAQQVRRLRKAVSLGISDDTARDLEADLAVLEAQLKQLEKDLSPTPQGGDAAPPAGTRQPSEAEVMTAILNRL